VPLCGVVAGGGGWRRVAAGGGGWRRVAAGGGGWRRVAAGGGMRHVVPGVSIFVTSLVSLEL
jgi:hypothetical protein